ncbi:MAG: response regulator transcription factor [Filomicrobium sp.]
MAQGNTDVLLVDDHAIVREGYRRLLSKNADLTVVAEADDASAAYRSYKEKRPDLVIMDISMPGRGGIDAIEHIRRWDPDARVIVSTMHSGAAYVMQAFRAGAKGYISKSSPPELLVNAVRDVARGKVAICPEISRALALSRLEHEQAQLEDLSPREFEVLRMILDAKSATEIASALNISRKTVANYNYNIKSKLGVSSDIELFYFALRQKLVDVDVDVPPKDASLDGAAEENLTAN